MYIFDEEKMTIIIPIDDVEPLMSPIQRFIDDGFRIKDEFHITLIGFARGREIKAALQQNQVDKEVVIANLHQLLENAHFEIEPTGEYYRLEKEVLFSNAPTEFRESIITLLRVPGIEEFWLQLESVLGMTLPVPFPHVTLATRGRGSEQAWIGIGVKDEKVFHELKKEKILVL